MRSGVRREHMKQVSEWELLCMSVYVSVCQGGLEQGTETTCMFPRVFRPSTCDLITPSILALL